MWEDAAKISVLGVQVYAYGLYAALGAAWALAALGLRLRRFKTGTPPRVNRRSIDFSKMQLQPGDDDALPFSFETAHAPETAPCAT